MLKLTLGFLLACTIAIPIAASDDDSLVRFDGGIGVHPVSNVSGTPTNAAGSIFPEVTRNIVRGVNPAGQIWVISALTAEVKTDGSIGVRGKGLLLAGGNNIGLNANASVIATLICEAAAPFVLRNTAAAGVPLEPNGDFRIEDKLSPAPEACPSPVLLIRNAAGGGWFAAGILKLEN
jgi:hypothetical protein